MDPRESTGPKREYREGKLTELLDRLFVGLAALDALCGGLGLLDDLAKANQPAVAVKGGLGHEAMLLVVDLEVQLVVALLAQIGSLGLLHFASVAMSFTSKCETLLLTMLRMPWGAGFSVSPAAGLCLAK